MGITKISSYCSYCGAPLTQIGENIFCEYCGQKYIFNPLRTEAKSAEEQQDENPALDVDKELSSFAEQAQTKKTAAGSSAWDEYFFRKEVSNSSRIIFFSFMIISIIILCYTTTEASPKENSNNASENIHITQTSNTIKKQPTKEDTERRATETAVNRFVLTELIFRDQYGGVVYPAASNENLPVATAVILEYADANNLIFSLFVHNQSGKDIDPSSLQEHLEIDSLAVTDDLQDEFSCSLQKDNWDEGLFLKSQTGRKGMINCSGSLNPESSLILIDFDMPNWGSSHLEIAIQADNENMQSSIGLELAPESYGITIELNSEKPQLVWVKKSDIAISDDMGSILLLDGCIPTTSQQGADEYFLTLTYPSGYDDRFYDKKLITCEYDEPFPSETNTMSTSLKTTSEKTFTSQAVINKSEGLIIFNE